MTFGLQRTGDTSADLPFAETVPSDFGETFAAGRKAEQIETNSWSYAHRRALSIYNDLSAQLGPEWTPDLSDYEPSNGPDALLQVQVQAATREVARRRASEPVGPWQDLPSTAEEFEASVTKSLADEHSEAARILENGSAGAEFLGRMWTGVLDDSTLMTAPFGLTGRAGVLATAGIEGGLSAGAEAMTLPRQYEMAERLGLPEPDPWLQIGMAGLAGVGLGALSAGAQRALTYRQTREDVEASRRPADQPAFQPERDLATAEVELDGRRPARGTPTNLPEPENWNAIQNGIFAGESGGDYNALFLYQNRAGGRYENVRLTEMTVDDWIRFSDPSGEYGQWVKGRIGRVATPMGAYQVVGTTLRAAKKGLNLRGDEVMTEAMQDQIGIWIYRRQGTGAWEGYRGPRSGPPDPFAADTRAPSIAPYRTSRGYTAQGQVLVGDETRIDVQYEVVDIGTLRPASDSLQPRDRGRTASDAWIADTAARLDPALLLPSPTADRGAPIIGPDQVIESGNGRARAIQRAYDRFPDRAAAYRAQIEDAGFAVPEGVDRPVLVARRTTELDDAARAQLVVDAQDSGVARMTASERARVGQRALSADQLASLRPGVRLTDARNRDFVRAFADTFPRSERNAFIDAEGRLSTDGIRQIQDSLFARAWDAPDIIARAIEGERGELRSLVDAMAEAAPALAQLRADIDAGLVAPEMDITPFVIEAARIIISAREAAQQSKAVGAILEELLDQVDLFGDGVAPLTKALVRFMAPEGRQAPAKRIAAFLSRYADEARQSGRTGQGLVSDVPGPLDVLQRIEPKAFKDVDAIEPPQPALEVRAQIEPVDFPESSFADGAASPESVEADVSLMLDFQRVSEGVDLDIDELRTFARNNPNLEIEMPDSSVLTVQEVMDDLDADDALATVIDLCSVGGRADG